MQLALEEVLGERVAAGHRGPTLRFWEWSEPALILGSHQVLANEVDQEAARELGFAIGRRMSGGGTMIVEPGRTVTYSLFVGVPASYRPINDIVSPEGKIGGAAQVRRRGIVVHHTAIAHAMDTSIVARLIRIGRQRVSPLGVRSAEREVSPLSRWLALSRDQVVAALAGCFTANHPSEPAGLTEEELAAARSLAERKYATAEWIDRLR